MHLKVRLGSLVLVVLLSVPQAAWCARFIDTGDWTEKYINRLSDKGVIGAAEDGKFHPDKPITRAQLAVWLVKVLGIENQPVPSISSFADVKTSDWFFKSVEIVTRNKYISAYPDGFRPNQFLLRAEVLCVIAHALQMPELDSDKVSAELSKFSDGDKVPAWAKQGVAQAALAGVFCNEKDEHKLDPQALAMRADVAAFLSKLDEYEAQKVIAKADEAATSRAPVAQAQTAPTLPAPVAEQPQSAPFADTTATPAGGGQQPPISAQVSREQFSPPPVQPEAAPPAPTTATTPAAAQYTTQQAQFAPTFPQQQPHYLQGAVSTVAAGTELRAHLSATLDSSTARVGDRVVAVVNEPVYVDGRLVLPSGSRFTGNVTYVRSAKRFRAGQFGKLEVRFVFVETPDGRRFPINGSVDEKKMRLAGGTTIGRVGHGLKSVGIGAGSGAAAGTAVGAIFGLFDNQFGKSVLAGALVGTTLGGTTGAVVGLVRKGEDVRIAAGTPVPIRLQDPLTISAPIAPEPPQYTQSLPAYMPTQSAAYSPPR